jgi:hypothetical protein
MCHTEGTVSGSRVPRLDGGLWHRIAGIRTHPGGQRPAWYRPSSPFQVPFPVLCLYPFLCRPHLGGLGRHLVACSNPPFLNNDLFLILPRFILFSMLLPQIDTHIFSDKQCVVYLLKTGRHWNLSGNGILAVKRRGYTMSLMQQGSQTARNRKIKTKWSKGIQGLTPKAVK